MANNLDNRVEEYLLDRIEEIANLDGEEKLKAEKQFNDMYGQWNKAYEINNSAAEKRERLEFEKEKAEKDRRVKALEGQVEFEKLRFEREKLSKQRGLDIMKNAVPVIQTTLACGFGVAVLGIEKAILNDGNIVSGAVRNVLPKLKFF